MKGSWPAVKTGLVFAGGFAAAFSIHSLASGAVSGTGCPKAPKVRSAQSSATELPNASSTLPPALDPRYSPRASFDRAAQKSSPLAWDLFLIREGHDPLAVVARAIRGYPAGHRLSVNALPPRDAHSHTWDWMIDPGPLTYPPSAQVWDAFDFAATANTVEAWDRFLRAYPSDPLLTAPARAARSRARPAQSK